MCGGCAFSGNSMSSFQIGAVVANMLMQASFTTEGHNSG
jgi:hypothetical protein